MGKMKLTKDNRRAGKSGIPNWVLTTIIFVVIAAVLLTCVASLVSSTGLVMRVSNAVVSENYKVTGNMMTYFYMLTYNNFASNYSSYLDYFSLEGYYPEDHRLIPIGGTEENPNTYDTMFLGNYDGTWFDYFMAQTISDVKTMLIYCEEADVIGGLELTKEEKQTIEASIDAAITEYRIQNIAYGGSGEMSESACLTAMYGNGVKRSDIRKAMEISTLASKCSEYIYDKIESAVTDEKINKEYNDNNKDFDGVDYFFYRFSVNYTDITKDYQDSELETKKDEILKKYQEKIAEVKALAAELEKKTDLEDFKEYVLNYVANDKYDELYDDEKPTGTIPSEENLKTIKEKMIAEVVSEVMDGKDETEDVVKENNGDTETTYTIYDISITKDFAKAIRTVREDLFTNVNNTASSNTVEKASYTKDDEFSEWAFHDDRREGDIKKVSEGDGSEEGEIKVDKKYYRDTVYFLTSTSDRDETNSRNVAYMLFSSTTTAKTAIEALKKVEGLNEEKFAEVANKNGASGYAVWEDYLKGEMMSSSFDEWLYGEKTEIGSITETPITMSDGSIMVAFYVEDGEVVWKVEVKDSIIEEEFEAREDKMTAAHSGSISESEWTISRIGK